LRANFNPDGCVLLVLLPDFCYNLFAIGSFLALISF